MRKTISFLLVLGFGYPGFCQPMLNGIINHYAAVTQVDTCANSLALTSTSDFSVGESILIVQMQGAEINTSNNPSFGDVIALHAAGSYEKAIIGSINGNTLVLAEAMVNRYEVGGRVQVVSLPVYADATISGTLTAPAWNGQTGGILALETTDQLTLNADIDVTNKGFRGGTANITDPNDCSWLINNNNYAYGLNNWRGAAKGEGIAVFTPGGEAGRGAQANGGGGGNDHNSGGGGGGNITAGGQGGNNEEPATFGCHGLFPGRGGKAAPNLSDRLYLGGGGGAGHENNGVGTDGGNGGGIIILLANTINANGHSIKANGQTPPNGSGDGAGGGGAGGTVLLIANQVNGTLQVEVRGGAGGQINNNNQARCFGPGGGGSGGRLLTTINGLNTNVSGGAAGQSINSSECPNSTNGAVAGSGGISALLNNIDGLPQGDEPNTSPAILNQTTTLAACSGQSLLAMAETTGFGLYYQWQINSGSGFVDITNGGSFSGAQSPMLSINPASTGLNGQTLRLRIRSDCFSEVFSTPIPISVAAAPTAAFNYSVNGLSVQFTNQSTNGLSYEWDFGDGMGSQQNNPGHTYAQSGTYTVSLTVTNTCDTVLVSQVVTLLLAPQASFSVNPTEGCAPLTITPANLSTNATSYSWLFPGGMPNQSNLANPMVTYAIPGVYSITLIATNAAGSDTLVLTNALGVGGPPQASFNPNINGLTVSFSNTSTNATGFFWLFGDQSQGNGPQPQHTYSNSGDYTVTLVAFNNCGADTAYQTIHLAIPPMAAFSSDKIEGCVPLQVQYENISFGDFDQQSWVFQGGTPGTSTDPSPVVTYTQPGQYNVSLTVSGPLGSNTFSIPSYIMALPLPIVNFTYQVMGNQVVFTNTSTNANSYLWNFGDGHVTNQLNPTHIFSGPGAYEVTLNAENTFCANAIGQTIFISSTAVQEPVGTLARVYPNPVSGTLTLELTTNDPVTIHARLFDAGGRMILHRVISNRSEWDMSALPAGLYLFYLEDEQSRSYLIKIIKID